MGLPPQSTKYIILVFSFNLFIRSSKQILHVSKYGIPKLSNGKIDRKKIEELTNE